MPPNFGNDQLNHDKAKKPEANARIPRVTSTNFIEGAMSDEAATSSEGSPGTEALKHQNNQAKLPIVSNMAITTITNNQGAVLAASNPPAKMLNLLKKPLKGGTPVTARAATAKLTPIMGLFFKSPFKEGNIRVPVEKPIAPATRKKRPLPNAWLKMCAIAPLKAVEEPYTERDSAMKI